MNQHAVKFGSQSIQFTLVFVDRKTLAISVHPDLSVSVKAPSQASLDDIKKKVLKKAPWIIKQLDFFESFLPRTPKRKYISGETHKYLGKQYRLKVIQANSNSVKMKAGYIRVRSRDMNSNSVKNLLSDWYYRHSKDKLTERYERMKDRFAKYEIHPERLLFRRMKRRWGSCSKNKAIVLNPELIKAPRTCIDYVITHEMCHVRHHNHSKQFFQMLEIIMPNWQKWKSKLEQSMV